MPGNQSMNNSNIKRKQNLQNQYQTKYAVSTSLFNDKDFNIGLLKQDCYEQGRFQLDCGNTRLSVTKNFVFAEPHCCADFYFDYHQLS